MAVARTHADSHDLDKLSRWSQALDSDQPGQFPVYAMFIVGPQDRSAHDVFRGFRSTFQEAGAKFEHLVIFGQHGVSRTALELLGLLGQPLESLPLLILFPDLAAKEYYWARLETGGPGEDPDETSRSSDSGSDEICRMLLARIEDGAASDLRLASVPGLVGAPLGIGSMTDVVSEALRRASSLGLT